MLRWLFTLAALLSLMICVLALAALLRWDTLSLEGNVDPAFSMDVPWYVRLFKDHGLTPAPFIYGGLILPFVWRVERVFHVRRKKRESD